MNLLRLCSISVPAHTSQRQSQARSIRLIASTGAVLVGLAATLAPWRTAHAANNISLEYGPIQRNLPFSEIKAFADTKKPSGLLADLILFAKQEPDKVLTLLTANVPIKVTTMDRLVNSYIGGVILEQAGKVIQPLGSSGDPVLPLKAALVGGVKNDQISFLSFVQSYPVDMKVNGEKLIAIRKQVEDDSQFLPEILAGLQGMAAKFFPGFGLAPATGTATPQPSPTPSTPDPSSSPEATPAPTVAPSPSDSPAKVR